MSRSSYIIDLSDPSDLTQIIDHMISEAQEPYEARIAELEEEIEDKESEISDLKEELQLQTGETE